MSKKHVEEYYVKMASDYAEMKDVLKELQKSERVDVSQINNIKEKVSILESNYKRLSYVMFLLNMPNKKKKESRYIKIESKKLKDISEVHTKESIEKENKASIEYLKNID